jgi:hypothetical protein
VAEWHCGQNEAGYWQIQNLVQHHKQKKKGGGMVYIVYCSICLLCMVLRFVFQEKDGELKQCKMDTFNTKTY